MKLLPEPVVVTTKTAEVAVFVRVKVHVPVLGKPVSETLAVAKVQVGCAETVAVGVLGITGCGAMVTLAAIERQPSAFLAVTL